MADRGLGPLVGIGVLVVKDGKVLLGKRKNAHGAGEYASPGGHLEHLESFAACAVREVREECGIEIGPVRFLRVLEVMRYAPKHYVDIAVVADWVSGEPQTLEPDKESRAGPGTTSTRCRHRCSRRCRLPSKRCAPSSTAGTPSSPV